MGWQIKLALMNLAVVAALYYRWRLGSPTGSLVIAGIVMIAVGLLMLRKPTGEDRPDARCDRTNAPKVLAFGLGTGGFSGFFGIGGGFLIVPGLMASTRMPMINAVGTSLVAVTAFGLTTALNYAASG